MPKPVSLPEIEDYAVSALRKWLKKTFTFAPVRKRLIESEAKNYQVDISICTAERMAKINHAFRKIKEPTDILSFPTHEFFQRQGVLGDLVLCGPVALKQADRIGHSWKKEIDVLLVHGILHLLHFDHETGDKDAKEMAAWESKILGATYTKSLINRVHDDAAIPPTQAKPAKKKAVAKKKAAPKKAAKKKSVKKKPSKK